MTATSAAVETSTTGRPAQQPSGFAIAAILIVVGVIATTLSQPQVLGRLPLQNMMKNEMHISRADSAGFFFLIGLPWYFKPLAGVLTDAFPIFGTRRKSYLIVSGVLATLVWAGIAFTPHQYGPLLWMCLLLSVFMTVASTVVGAFMVEIAQATGGSGRLSSIRQVAQMVVTFIAGPASGYLGSIAFAFTAGACGLAMFIIVPATLLLLREQRQRIDSSEVLRGASEKISIVAGAKTMWAAAAVTGVVFLAPGLSTAIFYRQQDVLHMTTNSGPGLPGFLGGQGFLSVIGASGGLASAAFYAWVCRRHDLRTTLAGALVASGVVGLGLLFYTTATNARILAAIGGFGGTLVELALMDLALRATPAGAEGMGFSLLMSSRNLCLFAADWAGSKLLDTHLASFEAVVWITSIWTAACAALVFLLPHHLTRRKDAEVYEEYPEPATAVQE
jgi:MFS family permease